MLSQNNVLTFSFNKCTPQCASSFIEQILSSPIAAIFEKKKKTEELEHREIFWDKWCSRPHLTLPVNHNSNVELKWALSVFTRRDRIQERVPEEEDYDPFNDDTPGLQARANKQDSIS